MKWLEKRGEIRRVPQIPWPQVDEYDPQPLSDAEQDAVLEAIPEDRRGIFYTMGLLGLRPGEARALEVADYNPGAFQEQGQTVGVLYVSKAAKGPAPEAPIRGTKTRRARAVPVHEDLRSWIERHVDLRGRLTRAPLFVNPATGRRWGEEALRRTWDQACEKAAIRRVPLYQGTKHSFATIALEDGATEREIQEMFGHRDARSTRRYARLANRGLVRLLRSRTQATPPGDGLSLACRSRGKAPKKAI